MGKKREEGEQKELITWLCTEALRTEVVDYLIVVRIGGRYCRLEKEDDT